MIVVMRRWQFGGDDQNQRDAVIRTKRDAKGCVWVKQTSVRDFKLILTNGAQEAVENELGLDWGDRRDPIESLAVEPIPIIEYTREGADTHLRAA